MFLSFQKTDQLVTAKEEINSFACLFSGKNSSLQCMFGSVLTKIDFI